MLLDFKNHLDNHFPFLSEKKLLIAISGGIDSIVLSHLLHELKYDISFAHCNFKLRGKESDDDEIFITNLAKEFGVKLYVNHFETGIYAKKNKLSIQLAARKLRYQWFKNVLKEDHFDFIITGHNTNDNLETFLINLSRGTGLEGLIGIPPINQEVVRPLLAFSRENIFMYAIKNAITWREDKSNASIKYIRNKVRHKVLPILMEINPNLLDSFKNTLNHLNESQEIVNEKVDEVASEIIQKDATGIFKINIKALDKVSNSKAYLYQILKDFGFTEWNDVFDLLKAQSGKQLFSREYRLIKDRKFLILIRIDVHSIDQTVHEIKENDKQISKPIRLKLEEVAEEDEIEKTIIYVDKALLKFPLNVRKWEYGDHFSPAGMQGTKKISRFFKDRKLSILDKENIWLLVSSDNEIIWVINYRQDQRFMTTKSSKNILKIATYK
jgi:tRNA(Ile)-lysidine synthase